MKIDDLPSLFSARLAVTRSDTRGLLLCDFDLLDELFTDKTGWSRVAGADFEPIALPFQQHHFRADAERG